MTKFLSAAIGAVAAAGMAISGAMAQEVGVANPKSVLPNFDIQAIGPVLNELGVSWQSQGAQSGADFIAADVAGQVRFIMAPTACRGANNSDCVGLNMVAIYDGYANPQTVQAFNYRYAFASAGIDPSGSAYISRYEIADFGAQKGNLATSIQVFVNQVLMFGNELATAGRTVSLEGYADDLSASMLNRAGLSGMTGETPAAMSAVEAHHRGFESAAAEVKSLIADKAAPRNKIENLRAK